MDLFLASCQALGLGLAAGALAGAVARDGSAVAALALGAIAGGAAGALSISADDEALAVGALLGLFGGLAAAIVVRGVVAGAARRAEGGSPALALIVAIAAVVLAALSILVPPVSLAVLGALLWLFSVRRRRAARKHEGLRVLR
jgi:hypothetical protein